MTFLELCQMVRQESDIAGQGPVSVTAQRGQAKYIVDATSRAWVEIQQLHEWTFRRAEFTLATQIGVAEYSPSDATDLTTAAPIARFSAWYNTLRMDNNVLLMNFENWDTFRYIRTVGDALTQTGKPTIYTVMTDEETLRVWPIPDAVYTITGSFNHSPQVLATDADVPEIAEEFQSVIVWRACQYLARMIAAPELMDDAMSRERQYLARMRRRYLPQMGIAGSLA